MERSKSETGMMELEDKYIKTAIINMLNIYNNLKANVNIVKRMEHIKMSHVEYLRINIRNKNFAV